MGKPSGHNDRRETLLDVRMWNFDGQCPLSIVISGPELESLILNVLFLVKKKKPFTFIFHQTLAQVRPVSREFRTLLKCLYC